MEPAHPRWWTDLWDSPVAQNYTRMDEFSLVLLAQLVDEVAWGNASKDILAEIRQLQDRFGLSPLARRRLGWVVKAGDANDQPQPGDNVTEIRTWCRRALG